MPGYAPANRFAPLDLKSRAPAVGWFLNLAQKVVGATALRGYGRLRLPTRDALGCGTLTPTEQGIG
jgi:hypothetical protein